MPLSTRSSADSRDRRLRPASMLRTRVTNRRVEFAVILVAGSWRIYLNGSRLGQFLDREVAIECVLTIADEVRREGGAVTVLTQELFGELRVVSPALTLVGTAPAGLSF